MNTTQSQPWTPTRPLPWRYDPETRNILDSDGGIVARNGDSVYGDPALAETIVGMANTFNSMAAELERLRQALEDVFGLMDQAWLVRDIAHDAEPGFAMRQLEPMMKLAKARAALERGSK